MSLFSCIRVHHRIVRLHFPTTITRDLSPPIPQFAIVANRNVRMPRPRLHCSIRWGIITGLHRSIPSLRRQKATHRRRYSFTARSQNRLPGRFYRRRDIECSVTVRPRFTAVFIQNALSLFIVDVVIGDSVGLAKAEF
jgi:hypothetical protein